MPKCTPDFNDMVSARGGAGSSAMPSGKGSKMPAPPKSTPKGGKMVKDTDKDGY